MNPQPPSNDLAERFALIIDGLCKAVVTPQGPFRAVFFFFMRRRIQKELELIGQQFAHLIELLRAGKLTPAPASDSLVDSDAASSPPAPAVPTSERPGAVDRLSPANHDAPGAGEGSWWTAPMADCHQPLAAGASGIAEERVDLAPAPATALNGCEPDRVAGHAAEAVVRRKRMIRAGEPRPGKLRPGKFRPVSAAAQFPSFRITAELASPRLAWRRAVRARPPDPGFFAGGFAPGVNTT